MFENILRKIKYSYNLCAQITEYMRTVLNKYVFKNYIIFSWLKNTIKLYRVSAARFINKNNRHIKKKKNRINDEHY